VIVAPYLATPAGHVARSPVDLALSVFGLGAAYGIALSFRLLRDERARLADALGELRRSRAAQVETARVEERARLAREIHDVLAHTLSALAMQLEGARLLLRERPADPAADEAVARAQRLARDGLEEARRAVGTLRCSTPRCSGG
jgi:signal transduction histidine kinase